MKVTKKLGWKERIYSLKEFRKVFVRKILKIFSTIPSEERPDILKIVNRLKEKHLAVLGINPMVLIEFSKEYDLNQAKLDRIYSECSSIIHNQPPLPFFSLLEIKFFKHFLERYLTSLCSLVEKLVKVKIELKKIRTTSQLEKQQYIKECWKATDLIERKYGMEIESIIEKALIVLQKKNGILIDPLTLASIFHIVSPFTSHLKNFSFTREDMEDIVENLSLVSYKIGIREEMYTTLKEFQKIMMAELGKLKEFSSLKSSGKKEEVIFYLLLLHLPGVIKKKISSKI